MHTYYLVCSTFKVKTITFMDHFVIKQQLTNVLDNFE